MGNISKPFIWAHRGASGHEVDNTLESFELALKMGADGLESDVHQSKDGVLIFYHEDKVIWQGKKVNPSTLTIEELESIDLGNGRRIPRVSDIFEYFKNMKNKAGEAVRYSFDIKRLNMGIPLVKLAEQLGIAEQVEITPNDNFPRFWRYVEWFRELSKSIVIVDSAHFNLKPLKILFGKMFYQNWEKFKLYELKGINVKAAFATDELIEEVKSRGLKVYVWDCHDRATLEKFMTKRIDAVYSNYPDLAAEIRNRNGK